MKNTFDEVLDALALALTQCSQESRPVFASAQARLARLQEEINDYAGKLDWREISPTGDDFNHLLDLLSSENSLPPFNADPAFRAQMDALKETTEILNAIFDEAPMARSNSPTLGHPKFPQAGRPDYDDSGVMAMRAAASLRR